MSKPHSILLMFVLLPCFLQDGLSQTTTPIRLCIRPDKKHQQIENFAASDAWRTDFVGRYWPLAKREQAADLLFSTDLDAQGNPIGIGLSCWRVNVGAGSYENREHSEVTSRWNRTECFLRPDGTYDFGRQPGQQWFMQAARQRGMNNFLFFTNSAPYFMTRSGSTLAPDSRSLNLRADCYDAFADFLARTVRHFQSQGFNVPYVSPINEPQVAWHENSWQEGSAASSADCHRLLVALDSALTRHHVPARILFGEAADMKYLFATDDTLTGGLHVADDLIRDFFAPGGRYDLTRLPHLDPCLTAHDYWTAWPPETLVNTRRRLRATLRQAAPGTRFWASEYCILEKNDQLDGPPSPDRSLRRALYVARLIHADLVHADASAWQWWTAFTLDADDAPIQLLPYEGCTPGSLMYDGELHPTKLLWATGNYSRFVRPGMWRIEVEGAEEEELRQLDAGTYATALLVSAYADEAGKEVVAVFVNSDVHARPVRLECGKRRHGRLYVTSANQDLDYAGEVHLPAFTLPARSVTTIVLDP